MLSGLTSKFGGLTSKLGGTEAGESPAPDAAGENPAAPAAAGSSVFTSVTSSFKMPSFFGGAKPAAEGEAPATEPAGNQEEQATRGFITPDKGVTTATEAATGGPDLEKPEQIPEEDPGTAAGTGFSVKNSVSSFGYSIFESIKSTSQKIKQTNILSEFQKEHESFLSKKSNKNEPLPPWIGFVKEDELKAEILSLSTDRRNFVRSPPAGVAFAWDWEEMAPIAKAILKDDPNLEKMRYELVPKVVSEENFWRNYFYRVNLLKESLSEDESGKKKRDSVDTDEEDEVEKELNEELKSFEVVDSSSAKKSEVDEKELDSLLDLK